ncbi:MAG TPA: nitroreductase, partial [Marinilabiliales bacterium]|nr:nitroreductase [Marinilabiliales bacterium]
IGEAKRIYDLNCLASVWTCIENFLLSLAEHNVYGVTFIPQNIEAIKEKFGIPIELEIASIIPIGYMAENAKILKQKTINITERKHYEKW